MKKPNIYELSRKLGKCLLDRGWRIAVAESCTGGGLAYAITSVAGSSEWFDRGMVTYTNQAKMELLDVKSETLQRFGAVSIETASEMAEGVLKHSDANISLSITGIAGPDGGTDEKPVGTVCFGLAIKQGSVDTRREQFFSGRTHIRDCSIGYALSWLLEAMKC